MIQKINEFNEVTIYDVLEGNESIGSIEFIEKERFLENVYLIPECRGKGYLRKIIDYFGKPLIALPLPQHIQKFEHLGFSFFKQIGEDKYYKL